MLEVDDSDHSSMFDECLSSDEYEYDSDQFDEFYLMDDDDIIDRLCPYRFLNLYAHNWEGYRLLDFHMNDVWAHIQECRMKNARLRREWRRGRDAMADDRASRDKPPKVGCLIFCSESTIPLTRINSEIAGDAEVDLDAVGRSVCTIARTFVFPFFGVHVLEWIFPEL